MLVFSGVLPSEVSKTMLRNFCEGAINVDFFKKFCQKAIKIIFVRDFVKEPLNCSRNIHPDF